MVPSQLSFLSSTQTDPLATALVVILLYYVMSFRYTQNTKDSLKIVTLVPLFFVSKTTGLILSIPIFLYYVLKYRRFIYKNKGKITLYLLITIIPSIPYVFRTFENLRIGSTGVFVSDISPSGIFVNFARILFSSMQTPIIAINNFLDNIITNLLRILRLEINPIGYGSYGDFYLSNDLHGDVVGNTFYVLLLTIATIGLFQFKNYRKLILLILAQAFLLSFIIGWQPWVNRFTSTLFVIGSIMIAIYFCRKKLGIFFITFSLLFSSFWIFYNPTRSLLDPRSLISVAQRLGVEIPETVPYHLIQPREIQYFALNPEIQNSYIGAIDTFNNKRTNELFISIGSSDYEYPIWALTRFEVKIYHFENTKSQLNKLIKGNATLFCTLDCSDLGLKLVYKGDFASLWSG
jgi:hypothetical protein